MMHPLASYRASTGLSRDALAKKAGTTRQTIHRIEAGEQRPSWDLVARLIDCSDGKLNAGDFMPPASPTVTPPTPAADAAEATGAAS